MVYTDYNVAIVYECQTELADNTCEEGQAFVDILVREGHTFTQGDLQGLEDQLEHVCLTTGDMVMVEDPGN